MLAVYRGALHTYVYNLAGSVYNGHGYRDSDTPYSHINTLAHAHACCSSRKNGTCIVWVAEIVADAVQGHTQSGIYSEHRWHPSLNITLQYCSEHYASQ